MGALALEDRVFRTRTEKRGGHWHVRVFSAKRDDLTFAKLGDLVMDEADYARFTQLFPAHHIQEEPVQ
jgi:hypothetical protein